MPVCTVMLGDCVQTAGSELGCRALLVEGVESRSDLRRL